MILEIWLLTKKKSTPGGIKHLDIDLFFLFVYVRVIVLTELVPMVKLLLAGGSPIIWFQDCYEQHLDKSISTRD